MQVSKSEDIKLCMKATFNRRLIRILKPDHWMMKYCDFDIRVLQFFDRLIYGALT
jgi:hypothetical protein